VNVAFSIPMTVLANDQNPGREVLGRRLAFLKFNAHNQLSPLPKRFLPKVFDNC
jgi:hypothetical protein